MTAGVEPAQRKSDAAKPRAPRADTALSRAAWHFIVDIVLLASALTLIGVSATLQFVFPSPTKAGGWLLWGWTYDQWSEWQFASLCFFVLAALVHVMLQWDWVCTFVVSRLSRARGRKVVVPRAVRTLYGVGSLIVVLTLLGILLAVADFTVRPPP